MHSLYTHHLQLPHLRGSQPTKHLRQLLTRLLHQRHRKVQQLLAHSAQLLHLHQPPSLHLLQFRFLPQLYPLPVLHR